MGDKNFQQAGTRGDKWGPYLRKGPRIVPHLCPHQPRGF